MMLMLPIFLPEHNGSLKFYMIGLPEHGDVDPGGGAAEAGVEDVGGHGVRVTPRHLGPGPGA